MQVYGITTYWWHYISALYDMCYIWDIMPMLLIKLVKAQQHTEDKENASLSTNKYNDVKVVTNLHLCFHSSLLPFLFHFFSLFIAHSMPQGYTALPVDDNGGGTSSSTSSSPKSMIDRVRQLWNNTSNDESAPLLDRKHMTLEPPKRTTTKVTLTAVLLVFTLLLFGAGIAVWIETEPGKYV